MMRLDEALCAVKAVDARRVVQICAARILMPLAKAHQGLVGPGILIVDRDLDDPGRHLFFGIFGLVFKFLNTAHHLFGRDHVRIKAHLE